jgi:hypothetical protein
MDPIYKSGSHRARCPAYWEQQPLFRSSRGVPDRRSSTACACFPTRAGACTWGTCATTPSPTSSAATSACRAQRAPADGLGCLRPARGERRDQARRRRRRSGRYENIATCAGSSSAWASPTTGDANWPPASPSTTAGSSGCSCGCYEKGLVYKAKLDGQLGPGRPDRARQRAGHRRPRLALRCAGRAPRDSAVVPEDHRLCRGAARELERLPGWPEQVKTMQANWIGRSEGLELDFDSPAHRWPATRP